MKKSQRMPEDDLWRILMWRQQGERESVLKKKGRELENSSVPVHVGPTLLG